MLLTVFIMPNADSYAAKKKNYITYDFSSSPEPQDLRPETPSYVDYPSSDSSDCSHDPDHLQSENGSHSESESSEQDIAAAPKSTSKNGPDSESESLDSDIEATLKKEGEEGSLSLTISTEASCRKTSCDTTPHVSSKKPSSETNLSDLHLNTPRKADSEILKFNQEIPNNLLGKRNKKEEASEEEQECQEERSNQDTEMGGKSKKRQRRE